MWAVWPYELFVRAEIRDSERRWLWTSQPAFLSAIAKAQRKA
jgi:hypothetical protein